MGKLFVVSTPIGNLEDITWRAKRVLSKVDIIACEDTRKTGLLLKRLAYLDQTSPKSKSCPIAAGKVERKPLLLSYYEENELRRIPELIKFLKEGKNVALVSNAGTPTLSDPGFKLVKECLNQDIKVEIVPGASALLAALVSSGLPTDKFLFLGYLPKKSGKRKKVFQNLTTISQYMHLTVIIYESPHRLPLTLEQIKGSFGDIEIVICRELTKLHEEVRREKISSSLAYFSKTKPKGEFTLVFRV